MSEYSINKVDWDDHRAKVSKNFTVHEATYLPGWRIHHTPSEVEKENILRMAAGLQGVRDLVKRPIIVHCWIRPTKVNCPGHKKHNKNYNKFVGSTATTSAHITGEAVDYHVLGFAGPEGCNTIRLTILPFLERLGLRMEDITGPWIHNDIAPVINNRFYKP